MTGSPTIKGKVIATAEPPTWYNLPSASGITGTAQYCKDQFGFVHIAGRLSGVAMITAFATLPPGFRPQTHTIFIAAQSGGVGLIGVARIETSTNGVMTVTGTDAENSLSTWLDIEIGFPVI